MGPQWFSPPAGTTAQRPTPTTGMTRYNTTLNDLEVYNGINWNSATIFGARYDTTSSDNESSTTSTSWVQKLRLTISDISTGNYRVGWYAEIRSNSTSSDAQFRVQGNDSVDLCNVNIEPQDGTSYFPVSGFIVAALSDAASYYVDIDYSSENAAATAYIRRARLEFWRVS